MLCATISRPLAKTTDFFAERRKMDFNCSMWTSPIFCQTPCFVQPFYDHWLKLKTFCKKAKMEFHWSMRMSPIFSQKVYSAQPFYGMWPKIQTFWQKNVLHRSMWMGSNIQSKHILWAIILKQVAQTTYFPQTCEKKDGLCDHFTAWGPNYRLFSERW